MRSILEDDRLNAPSEVEETLKAILKWVSADAAARKGYLAKFLPLVRFVRCSVWKNSSQFETLTPEEMRSILEDDRLNAPSEVEETLKAILKWVSADAAARKGYLAKFLPLVRFVRCSVT
ncbi:hypothetical protein MTO96_016305 [Rhipicephalus appendiculatus]